MDDDKHEREFSRGIVYGFFEQAESTFDKMEKALLVPLSHSYCYRRSEDLVFVLAPYPKPIESGGLFV